MAGGAEKKQARYNASILKDIHTVSVVVNLLAILCLFVFHRPQGKKPYLILSIPSWVVEYILEKTGRPVYKLNEVKGYPMLVSAGEDLRQQGLTEYMFDVFYLTMGCDIFMCILGSNYCWWLLALIPMYAAYKLASLWLGMRAKQANASQQMRMSGNNEPVKSKRQQKLEARQKKARYVRG